MKCFQREAKAIIFFKNGRVKKFYRFFLKLRKTVGYQQKNYLFHSDRFCQYWLKINVKSLPWINQRFPCLIFVNLSLNWWQIFVKCRSSAGQMVFICYIEAIKVKKVWSIICLGFLFEKTFLSTWKKNWV